jgi:hypothetical protein
MLRLVVVLTALVAWPLAAAAATLVDAAKAADAQAVRALLLKKADVNQVAPDGMTALHWAARNDDEATAQALVRAGAKVNVANRYGLTPLALAAQNGRGPMLTLLLAAGANANVATQDGETPIMTAARTGSVPAIKALAAHMSADSPIHLPTPTPRTNGWVSRRSCGPPPRTTPTRSERWSKSAQTSTRGPPCCSSRSSSGPRRAWSARRFRAADGRRSCTRPVKGRSRRLARWPARRAWT